MSLPYAQDERAAFGGRMPTAPGDLRIEANGIAPVPEDRRYGRAGRLFTVWFAPNLTMTGVFTGTVGIALGLDFATALTAVVLGTLVGAAPTAYLGTWGSRTGSGQLPLARLAFGPGVVLPGALQWLSSIAWDALIGLFGGDALAQLCGWPFWLGVLVMMAAQGALGVLGYEVIHRLQTVMTFALAAAFAVLAAKLLNGVDPVTASAVHGADRAGAFVLTCTIALSLALSWAPYASDFSRYLPRETSRPRMFWCTLGGISASFVAVQTIGLWGASVFTDQTARGIDSLLGGGALGAFGLLAVALAALCSNAMNDYSGSLALQTMGVRLPRPVARRSPPPWGSRWCCGCTRRTRPPASRTCCCSSATGSPASWRSCPWTGWSAPGPGGAPPSTSRPSTPGRARGGRRSPRSPWPSRRRCRS